MSTKDLFSGRLDLLSFADFEDFLGLREPVEARPTEGTLLDYKVDDSSDCVEAVAAFANTSGGLLFLGVRSDKQQNNAPIAILGIVFSGGDIKARVTAKIVSQVTPRPEFEIGVAQLPNDPGRFVVLVRVREGSYPPYQYARERDKIRFPIRVQDTSRMATLRDLEYLFSKRSSFDETTEERVQSFVSQPLFPYILETFDQIVGAERTAKPYHIWSIRPRVSVRLRLDRVFDEVARELVMRCFPDSAFGQFWPALMGGDRHILRWQAGVDSQTAPQMRWARNFEWTSSGNLRFSERIDRRDWSGGESVSDLFVSSLRFFNMVEDFYRARNYFGSLSALHTINLQPNVVLLPNFPGQDEVYRETDAIRFAPPNASNGVEISNVAEEIEHFAANQRVELVCDVMLTHLRQLRQASVDYDKLTAVVYQCPVDKPLGYFP